MTDCMTGSATTAMAADNDKRRDTALPLSLSVTVSYPTLLNYTLQIQLNSQLSRTPINPNWIWHKDKTTKASIAPIACRAICRPPRKKKTTTLPCPALLCLLPNVPFDNFPARGDSSKRPPFAFPARHLIQADKSFLCDTLP